MRSELDRIFQLLHRIEVSGYQNVKNLATSMELIAGILSQMEQGKLIVRRREEGKHETESQRKTD